MEQEHEIMTSDEVAQWMRLSKATLYKLIAAGKLPAFRMGSDWRFKRSAIEALLGTEP